MGILGDMSRLDVFSIEELKGEEYFLKHLRWDVVPEMLFRQASSMDPGTGGAAGTDGYMFYVELLEAGPALMIMRNYHSKSATVGKVEGVPEDLLRGAIESHEEECIAGIYPLSSELEAWLKGHLFRK